MMFRSFRFHALLLLVVTGLPFLGILRGEMWIPMVGDTAPPWGPPPASRIEDNAGSDLPAFTYPNLVYASRIKPWSSLLGSKHADSGALLWNPGQLCGTPFLATQDTFALHPAHWLPWTSGIHWQFAVLAWVHAWIAALGCYLLCRRLGLDEIAALFSATVFGAGPWMTAHHDTLATMTAAWIPWLSLLGINVLATRRYQAVLGLALATCIAALSGMAQFLQIGIAAVAISIREGLDDALRTSGRRERVKSLARLCAALGLGLALAAPQLLPLAELAVDAPRAQSSLALQSELAVPLREWLTLGWAELAGTPAAIARAQSQESDIVIPAEDGWPTAKLFGARTRGGATYMEAVVSPGACAFALMLIGLAVGRQRARPLALALGVVGFLVSTRGPWWELIQHLPTLSIGNPRRWMVLTALGASLLVGEGIQALGNAAASWRRGAAVIAAIPAFAWLLCLLVPKTMAGWLAIATSTSLPLCQLNLTSVLTELWLPAVLTLIATIVLMRRWLPRYGVIVLFIGIVVDLTAHATRVNPLLPATDLFPPTKTTEYLLKDHTANRDPVRSPTSPFRTREVPWRIARLTSQDPSTWIPPLPPNTPMLFGLRDAAGYEALVPPRLEALWSKIEPGSVHEHHYFRPFSDSNVATLPIMDFMGIRYWLATRAEAPLGFARVAAFADERTAIFENPHWNAHATWVSNARVVSSDRESIDWVTSREFNPRNEVTLTLTDARTLGIDAGLPRVIKIGDDSATLIPTHEGSSTCTYEVSAKSDGLLVISESFHRGWGARDQDGHPLALAPANHAFQAIFVPKGTSRVTWSFQPVTWPLGLGTCAAALLILLVSGILSRRNRL